MFPQKRQKDAALARPKTAPKKGKRKEGRREDRESLRERPSLGAGSCSHIFGALQPEDGCPVSICKTGFLETPDKWK